MAGHLLLNNNNPPKWMFMNSFIIMLTRSFILIRVMRCTCQGITRINEEIKSEEQTQAFGPFCIPGEYIQNQLFSFYLNSRFAWMHIPRDVSHVSFCRQWSGCILTWDLWAKKTRGRATFGKERETSACESQVRIRPMLSRCWPPHGTVRGNRSGGHDIWSGSFVRTTMWRRKQSTADMSMRYFFFFPLGV